MKKNIYSILIFVILSIVLFPLSVQAANYTITLDDAGGSGGSGSIQAKGTNSSSTTIQVDKVNVPTKKNSIFFGYYYQNTRYINSFGVVINKNWTIEGNGTLTAIWGEDKNSDWIKQTPREPYTSSFDYSGTNGYDEFTGGYGIYVKLIKYKNGVETEVGDPLLIYNDALLMDISKENPGASSDSGGNVSTLFCYDAGTGWCSETKKANPKKYENMVIIDTNNADNGFEAALSVVKNSEINRHHDESDWNCSDGSCGYIADTDASVNENGYVDAPTCQKYTSHTDSQNIHYYNKANILFETSSGTKSYDDFSGRLIPASSYNVNLKSVSSLYNLIKSCFINGVCSDENSKNLAAAIGLRNGNLSSGTITNLFGTIEAKELDTYYLSFEPVVRVPGGTISETHTTNTTKSTKGAASWHFRCKNEWCGISGTVALSSGSPSAEQDNYKCAKDASPEYFPTYYKGCDSCTHWDTRSECESIWGPGGCTRYGGGIKEYHYCEDTSTQMWQLGNPACASYAVTHYHTVIYNRYWHNSTITPARTSSSGTTALLSHMTTAIVEDDPDVKHKNEATGEEEYYVGPELETALVGECGNASNENTNCTGNPENKYSIVGSVSNLQYTIEAAKKTAIGVLYVWVPEIMDFCVDCKEKTGNDLLSCSENYCDNLYYYEEGSTIATQQLKEACIKRCGVENTPNSCEEMIKGDTEKKQQFIESIMKNGKGGIGSSKYTYNTICNKNASGLNSGTDKGYKAYCLMSSPSTNVIDQIHYVNVLCVESTSCDFSDISKDRLTKGRRIDYDTKAHVVKNCKVWFDEQSWKYYYATIPSGDEFGLDTDGDGTKEVYTSRERMLSIIDNYYNTSSSRGFQGSLSQNITFDGSDTKWEDLDYDVRNFKANLKVNEKYQGDGVESSIDENYELRENEESVDSEKHNVTDNTANDNPGVAYSYARESYVSRNLKTYSSSSSYDATYEIPKLYCIGEDRDATIIEYGDSGCGEKKLAVPAYFLNLHTLGANFNGTCENKVSVGGSSSATYYEAKDDCPVTEKTALCTITAKGPYHCGQFTGETTLKLNIDFDNTAEVKIKNFGLNADSVSVNHIDTMIIGTDSSNSGKHIYYGVVELDNGTKEICKKEIEVNYCEDNGCTIEEDATYNTSGTKRYYVIDGAGTYYARTGRKSSLFTRLGLENEKHVFYVQKDTWEEKDPETETTTEDVIGKVESGNTCKYCCLSKPVEIINTCDTDIKRVKEYCSENHSTDPHDFESEKECEDYYACSCPVPSISMDITNLTDWCTKNGTKPDVGFTSSNICVSTCCLDPKNCIASDNITYRPVSLVTPFPGSDEVDESKRRIVGRNWVSHETNITKAESGGTGTSVYNEAEYVIDLTPNVVREIRKQNAENNDINQSIYYESIDAREEKTEDGENTSSCNTGEEPYSHGQIYKGYCSKFVHTSGYFSVLRGHVIK